MASSLLAETYMLFAAGLPVFSLIIMSEVHRATTLYSVLAVIPGDTSVSNLIVFALDNLLRFSGESLLSSCANASLLISAVLLNDGLYCASQSAVTHRVAPPI